MPVSICLNTDSLHSFQDYHPDKTLSNKKNPQFVHLEKMHLQTVYTPSLPATAVPVADASNVTLPQEELHKECPCRQLYPLDLLRLRSVHLLRQQQDFGHMKPSTLPKGKRRWLYVTNLFSSFYHIMLSYLVWRYHGIMNFYFLSL